MVEWRKEERSKVPYNPGIQYRGDVLLFEGISRAGQAVGDGLEERQRQRQEFEALAKYAEAAGYGDKDVTTTMSLDQLKGFVRGKEAATIAEQRRTDDQRQQMLVDAQMNNFMADNIRADEAAAAAVQQRQRAGALWSAIANQAAQQGPNPDGSTVGDMNWQAIVNAAQRVGYDGDPTQLRALAEMIQGGRQSQETPLGPAEFDEDPITGARFVRAGRSLLPSGTNPAKMQPTPEPLTGPNGELLGYAVRSARGGMQIVKPPPEAMIEGDLDPENPGRAKGKMTIREYEQRFRKAPGAAAAPAAAANAKDPLGLFQ